MAMVSICPRISRVYHASNSVASSERRKFLVSSRRLNNLNVLHVKFDKFSLDAKKMERVDRVDGVEGVGNGKLESRSNEEQLRVLDSYFGKLKRNIDGKFGSLVSANNQGSESKREVHVTKEMVDNGGKNEMVTGLDSLENYFGKLNSGKNVRRNNTSSKETSDRNSLKLRNPATGAKMKSEVHNFIGLETMDNETEKALFTDENFQELQAYDEASDFCLINILAAINIGVFLFEIASPIRDSDVEHLTIPLIYGAKINKLILDGEWWRLFTPMFLVQD